jgi:FkbM family methyltransferase
VQFTTRLRQVLAPFRRAGVVAQSWPESITDAAAILQIHSQLGKLTERVARYEPGDYQLPFGTIAYVDALSFRAQFYEIFYRGDYNFNNGGRDDPLILDCGGNIGISAIWFKMRYPRSRVVVFEADPQIANVLQANVNRLALEGVEVVQAAVWHQTGTVPFVGEGADMGAIGNNGSARQVQAVRLADRITEPVDLLKLDVEGAECEILLDLCESGRIGLVRRLITEFHVRHQEWDRVAAVLGSLRQDGLQLIINRAGSAPHFPQAVQPTPFNCIVDGKGIFSLYGWREMK